MLISQFTRLAAVILPDHNRQIYMHEFDIANPIVPDGYDDAVRDLLRAVGRTEGRAFLTVDEKLLVAGQTQRKPKPHVDGYFTAGRWTHGWNHNCNNLPAPRMAVIVASTQPLCRAWQGEFDAQPKDDGDLSHVELDEGTILEPNVGYLLSPDCIHESLPAPHTMRRTFMRIALEPLI